MKNNIEFCEEVDKMLAEVFAPKNLICLNNSKGEGDFNEDRKKGRAGEDFVRDYLTTLGFKFISYNEDEKYDLLMEYIIWTRRVITEKINTKKLSEFEVRLIKYEVKTDLVCGSDTDNGNIGVEFKCKKKESKEEGAPLIYVDSGIATTESDYWVTYLPKLCEIWNINTSYLKQLISNNNFNIGYSTIDKKYQTKLYLISREKFVNYFKVYKI